MLLFANNAIGTLSSSVTNAVGQVAALGGGQGASFVGVDGTSPSVANPMRVVLTAVDGSGNDTGAFEIAEVTLRAGDNITLGNRGLEGTVAAAWGIGTRVECRMTAGVLRDGLTLSQWRGKYGSTRMDVLPGVALSNWSTMEHGRESLNYSPIQVTSRMIVTHIVLEVTTALATATCRVGICRADQNWQPGAMVVDGGVIELGTNGEKSVAVSVTLEPGNYLLMLRNTTVVGTLNYRRCAGADRFLGIIPGASNNRAVARYCVNEAVSPSVAFPDPPPAPTAIEVVSGGHMYTLWLRCSEVQ